LTSSAELSVKCNEDLFYEKCKGSCFFCPAHPPSPPPPCGNTDPSFCEAELPTLGAKIFKCGLTTFVEKCKGTCGYCPGAGRPPPSPPPSPWSPPPSAPACSDKEGKTCKKKKCDKYPLKKKQKCKKTCDLCGPLPPSSPPSPAAPPPETNCAGLADEKECTIKVKKCQKKPPKSMKKCQKNCKKDSKKKPPLCEKTCCELGSPPSPPCVPYSEAELVIEKNKCQVATENGAVACDDYPTKKKRKRCKQINVQNGIACNAALYCPPDGTKPPPA